MSRSKPVHVRDRFVRVYDNSQDIVVAHLVEAVAAAERVQHHGDLLRGDLVG